MYVFLPHKFYLNYVGCKGYYFSENFKHVVTFYLNYVGCKGW